MALKLTHNLACTRKGCPKIIQTLFDAPADEFKHYVHTHAAEIERMAPNNITVLLCAACFGHEAQVCALLSAGANINHQDKNGFTALMCAAGWSRTESTEETVRILLQHSDINVNLQNNNGLTALMFATINSQCSSTKDTVRMLLQHPGINVNLQDKDGQTALMNVVCWSRKRSTKTVRMFLQHPDINVNLQCKNRWTALLHAAQGSNKCSTDKTVRVLFRYPGINVNVPNISYRTAVDIYFGMNAVTTLTTQTMCLMHKIPIRQFPSPSKILLKHLK